MAYGALASGLIGAGIAAGDDAKQRMTNQNEEASKKRLLDMELETKMDFENRIYELKGERMPEEIRRTGLISAAEAQSKVDAEKLALNDPEYIKALRTKESIQNPDRDAEGRRLRNDVARLQLKNMQDDERIPKSVRDQAASLYKQADSLATSITNAELKGEATPEGLASAHARFVEINSKIEGLYQPYRGDAGAQDGTGSKRAGIDDLFPRKAAPAAATTATTSKLSQSVNLTGEQARTKARELISNLNTRDQMSIYNTRKALDALPQDQIGALRKEAGI